MPNNSFLRVQSYRLLFIMALFSPPCSAFCTPANFTDDFNRSDGPVGNGWTDITGGSGANLVISSGALSTTGPAGGAGIFRPIDYSGSVTATADLTQANGFGGLLDAYDATLTFKNDGSLFGGYGLNFARSDQTYANSSINLIVDGSQIASVHPSFQFGSHITPTVTVAQDGSVSGTVADGTNTFNFTFGPQAAFTGLSGTDFAVRLGGPDSRSAVITNPTLDNLSLAYTVASPAPPPQPSVSSHDFAFPLVTSKNVYLNTEAGGQVYSGDFSSNEILDPNHTGGGFYSLDFDTNNGDHASVVTGRDGIIVRIRNDARRNFDPSTDYNRTTVTIYHPDLSDPPKGIYIFSEYREFTLSDELKAKIDGGCAGGTSTTDALGNGGCTWPISQGIHVQESSGIGTLNGIFNEHLHFQIKESNNINNYGPGLSAENNNVLGGLTVGGRLFKDYQLTYPNGTILPVGDCSGSTVGGVCTGIGTQIYGPNDPALPVKKGNQYKFNVVSGNIGVGYSTPIFVDPLVAIGYDFIINSGPLFSSVLLPDVGDGLYDLYECRNGTNNYVFDGTVSAGIQYSFGVGVACFRVLGIEASSLLDPNDPTAFVTGLTFSGVGDVQFAMIPISQDVPEPSVGIYMLALGLCFLKWRHHVEQ